MLKIYKLLLFALLFTGAISFVSAASIKIIEPYNATIGNNGSIYLGRVGPGQPFYITALSATQNSSGTTIVRGWNEMNVTHIPKGWVVTNSSLNTQYISVEITPAANASTSEYAFNVIAQNLGNYSKLGNVMFTAYINVTPDVFTLDVYPTSISTGPGEPADIYVTINNTGVSDSPFYIYASKLPAWNRTEQVIALHQNIKTFVYPVYENEPGAYVANVSVVSSSSPLVKAYHNVNLTVIASVPNDYQAIGDGSIGFPIIYEPIYAIMYLINVIARMA